MTPYLRDEDLTLYVGDALDVLREMPAESVDCCVTSPPYYGLRDYGVDGQIGLEDTPEEYVARLVEVFRQVRRVLRTAGVCFLNLGDSYQSTSAGYETRPGVSATVGGTLSGQGRRAPKIEGVKPKDLLLMPARVALALQADGWWVRADIIWAKSNPMPESVTDRPTSAHEYVYLLSKSPRYWWDQEAVREPNSREAGVLGNRRAFRGGGTYTQGRSFDAKAHVPNIEPGNDGIEGGRNIRSVWTIATQPYPEAHFATFPEELARRCIAAGCPERVCATCGVASGRVVEAVAPDGTRARLGARFAMRDDGTPLIGDNRIDIGVRASWNSGGTTARRESVGWTDCSCHGDETNGADSGQKAKWRPGVVLDPFMGSGTVAVVARRMGRRAVGIELNQEYAALIAKRTRQLSLLSLGEESP